MAISKACRAPVSYGPDSRRQTGLWIRYGCQEEGVRLRNNYACAERAIKKSGIPKVDVIAIKSCPEAPE